MNQKIRIIVLSVLAVCAVVCASLAATAASLSESSAFPDSSEASDTEYILRLQDGEIIISMEGQEDIKTGITAQWLRSSDKDALKAGITVDSYEDIIRLLEDFGS